MSETAAAEKTADEFLRRFTRELPVQLNDHENQMYGKMLAEKCKEQELAIDKKKQVVADHNNRIKVITNEIKRLAEARAKGEELRPVMCGERLHGNVIEIIRIDRGEVVDTRPAELKDLQTELPGTGMPHIPDGFDEGPRGDGLGSLRDQPVDEPSGEMVESSTGGGVYVGDPEDHDEETQVESASGVDGEWLATAEPDDELIEVEDDGDEDEGDEPDNVVAGDFGGVPGQGDGESEDDMIERKLREREAGETDGADFGGALARKEAEEKAKKEVAEREKPKRERSAKKNGKKGKRK
jgi:hypothetical protein